MKEVVMVYRCTQQELYSIASTAIGNLESNLSTFAEYKGKYTPEFVEGLKSLRQKAIDLPSVDERSDSSETLKVQMLPVADECMRYFLFLKGYINDAYPEEERKIKYNTAGQSNYDNALRGNWEEVSGLTVEMKKFVTENEAVLKANNNMPDSFITKLNNASSSFIEKYEAFKKARQTSSDTAAKITANNELYRRMMEFMDEGKLLYAGNEEMKKLYTLNVLKSIVSPPGSASLRVILKNSDTSAAANINVTIKLSDGSGAAKSVKSDANGDAIFNGIDAGVYDVTVEYNPIQNYVKEVNTGVAARMEVVKS